MLVKQTEDRAINRVNQLELHCLKCLEIELSQEKTTLPSKSFSVSQHFKTNTWLTIGKLSRSSIRCSSKCLSLEKPRDCFLRRASGDDVWSNSVEKW